MLPEEKARVKIDKQLNNAGWDIVDRKDYLPNYAMAVKEALMQGGKESDYLLFVDNKAIGVVEAKKESDSLGPKVASQAEHYAKTPQNWYGLWFQGLIPLVYLANGNKIYFKNMLTDSDGDYVELGEMHSPKKMLQLIGKKSEYGALPRIEKRGLRDCQYDAEVNLEKSLKQGKKKALAVLATGSGKTYLACLASYRLLNYTSTKRVLFLVDRNNLARQTETEFSLFDRTENQQPMSSLYQINRLKNKDDIGGDIVISTIQKLFAVLTGQTITDDDEDKEDEKFFSFKDTDSNQTVVSLGNDLKLPPDYFQFIIIDECHRSIYGKWQSVLNYFKGATILGLTATPTPEAYAFFNDNIIEKYTYDDSVVDGVNVPARVYRIKSNITEHGGTINTGDEVVEITRSGKEIDSYTATGRIDFAPTQLDRSVIVPDQMRKVLTAYKDSIYTDLFPDRDEIWEYIPKTLIFAKDDNHATEIVNVVKEVFADKFKNGVAPDKFVQKITYSAGDSNALIRDLRTDKEFRIAVTVTLVATGTDVKPLEVVLFMNDVKSDVLYSKLRPYLNKVVIATKDGYCTTEILPLTFYGNIYSPYMQLFIMSPTFLTYVNMISYGVKMPRLGTNDGKNAIIAIPPINEQKRIRDKFDIVAPLFDKIQNNLNNLNNEVTAIKSKILDLAIRGKLVPQDPNDEPASVLLERIREEKEELIKQGKIKRDKMESVIFKGDDNSYYEKIGDSVACIDAELPFEIPDNWCWARLNCISINYDSYRKPINSYDRKNRVLGKSKDELYPYYGATGQIGFIDDFLFNGEYILLGEDAAPFLDKKAQKAYMIKGKSWVNNHAHILQSLVFPEYLTNCLNSIDYFDYVYGTTRLKLTQENMNRILVPVPSIEEQCKIAQAINNLFVLIESIKASLS